MEKSGGPGPSGGTRRVEMACWADVGGTNPYVSVSPTCHQAATGSHTTVGPSGPYSTPREFVAGGPFHETTWRGTQKECSETVIRGQDAINVERSPAQFILI